eukprot:gene7367-5183_t
MFRKALKSNDEGTKRTSEGCFLMKLKAEDFPQERKKKRKRGLSP